MGKSNRSKKVTAEVLRKYVKERTRWKWLAILSAVLFVSCCLLGGADSSYMWTAFVSIAIYIFCMIMFRVKSYCPYCGKAITSNFNKITHCPYCKRPIKEKTVSKDAQTLLKKR